MPALPFALFRRHSLPDQGAFDSKSTAWPWLLTTVVVVVVAVDVVAAAVLFAMDFPVASVLSLIGGSSGVAMTTVGYSYQLLGKGAAALPSSPKGTK